MEWKEFFKPTFSKLIFSFVLSFFPLFSLFGAACGQLAILGAGPSPFYCSGIVSIFLGIIFIIYFPALSILFVTGLNMLSLLVFVTVFAESYIIASFFPWLHATIKSKSSALYSSQ